ncbi:N-acyl-D-amino-acid deacylase [Agromyces badenianii]|uniref:N-acyl-D-amino-acid deacylase n=1 Tax=Agromyces badenianii TaxID=2080742 RepID=A0A2S0WX34_9MICO|nr:N-acyl-D-amino-acid deacylase [Agromyces badenianii]
MARGSSGPGGPQIRGGERDRQRPADSRAGGSTRLRLGIGIVIAAVVVTGTAVVGAAVLGPSGAADSAEAAKFDAIIRGGTVFDGAGSVGTITDVGIRNGHIAAIGDLSEAAADSSYDARGLYVTPGFIDVHAHTDTGEALADAKSSLTQGVTTETLGPDGRGELAIAEQLEELAAADKAINVAPYVGFGTVWADTMGENDARPTEAQLDRMRGRISEAMAEGAWGVSSGLGYTPAGYAKTDEVIEIVKAAAPWRTMFSDHMRDETNRVVESTEENIAIGAGSGLMSEATHLKVAGPLNWGKSSTMLELLADARAAGQLAGGDVYPYTAAQTGLSFYVSGWAKDGGTEAMLERFADPAQRSQIDAEVSAFVVDDVGVPENISFPTLDNATLGDLIAEYQVATIGEAVIRVLEENDGEIAAVMHIGSEDDLENFLKDPFVAISSDGGLTEETETHPRHYGTYPRLLGQYVRDQHVLEWPEAIRKITGLPATMLGMTDRGYIAEGMTADVTVFDPDTIIDRATFVEPKQYSEGVRWVFVNGALALDDGEPTGAHSGEALRRASSMPTRPQAVAGLKEAAISGTVTAVDTTTSQALAVDLVHDDGAPNATGTVVVTAADGSEIRSQSLGRLQTAPGWFSVSGIGRGGDGADHAFTVTVDEHDPLAAPGETRVTIQVDGADDTYGVLQQADGADAQ